MNNSNTSASADRSIVSRMLKKHVARSHPQLRRTRLENALRLFDAAISTGATDVVAATSRMTSATINRYRAAMGGVHMFWFIQATCDLDRVMRSR